MSNTVSIQKVIEDFETLSLEDQDLLLEFISHKLRKSETCQERNKIMSNLDRASN
jgi:hypothetical protein